MLMSGLTLSIHRADIIHTEKDRPEFLGSRKLAAVVCGLRDIVQDSESYR